MRLGVKYVRLSGDVEYEYRFLVSVYSEDDNGSIDVLLKPTEAENYTNDKVYEFSLKMPAKKPIVTVVSALGPIRNDYGRRCWRNCGTSVCYLNPESIPSSAKLMCNMAYGTSKTEKLSGIIYYAIDTPELNRVPAFDFQNTRKDKGVVFKLYASTYLRPNSNDDMLKILNKYEKNIKSIYTGRIRTDFKLLKKLNSLWVPLDYYYTISTNKQQYHLSEADFNRDNPLSRPGLPSKQYELLKSASACAREGLEILKATTIRGLPFFATLCRKTPQITIDYWTGALNVIIDRYFDGERDAFYRSFCESFEPGRRACYAAQIISLYAQSLEYVTDYVPVKDDEENHNRKEVEQFSSALINRSSDCEDMSVAMYQCYEAFVESVDSSVLDNVTTVDAMGVLSRMKKILKENYIPMIFADVIELNSPGAAAKHGNYAGAKTANEYYNLLMKLSGYEHAGASPRLKNYRRADDSEMKSVNRSEVVEGFLQSADSAHICMKLIPKSWFKKAVSRFDANAITLQSAALKNNSDTQKDDETLPVLFMEGTSLLFSSDEEPTRDALPFKYHTEGGVVTKSLSSYLLRDQYLNDVCKSINVPDKGFSKFYKGSAFACTTKFKDVGSYMFATCRKSENDDNTFEKGVSHDQISYKSKAVHFIPYASLFDPTAPECDPAVLDICTLQQALDHEIVIDSKKAKQPKSKSMYSYLLDDSLYSERLEVEMELWKTTLNDLVLDPLQKYRNHVVPTTNRVVSKIIFDPYYAKHGKTMASLTFEILSLFYDATIAQGDRRAKTTTLKNWSKKYTTTTESIASNRFFDEEEFDISCQTNHKHVVIAQKVEGMYLVTAIEKIATDVYQIRIEVHLLVVNDDDK